MNGRSESNAFEPAEELVIEDVETLKVIADPHRMRMIEAIGSEQLTAKEWAERLDEGVHKLYYHIRLLEKHGLVVVVDTQVVSGIIEKRYALSAHRFEIKPGLLSAVDDGDEALDSMVSSMLDNTSSAMRSAYRAGVLNLDDKEHTMFFRARLNLTRERAAELVRRVTEVIKEIGGDEKSGDTYGLTLAFHQLAPHRGKGAPGGAESGEGAGGTPHANGGADGGRGERGASDAGDDNNKGAQQ